MRAALSPWWRRRRAGCRRLSIVDADMEVVKASAAGSLAVPGVGAERRG
jgi:hypothetical protein